MVALIFSLNLIAIVLVLLTPVLRLVGVVVATLGAVLSIVYFCVYTDVISPFESLAMNLRVVVVVMVIGPMYLVLEVVGVVPFFV